MTLEYCTLTGEAAPHAASAGGSGNVQQEAVLKVTAVRSPLPAGDVVDSSLSSLSSPQVGGSLVGGGGSSGVRGVGEGEGGRGHFIHPA